MASKMYLSGSIQYFWKAFASPPSLSASHGVTDDVSLHELDGNISE